jgi:lipopolysaccharide/colanic/teichoic acid biosynthesis glycosyltransferase
MNPQDPSPIPVDIIGMSSNLRWHRFVLRSRAQQQCLRWWLQVHAYPTFKRLLDLSVAALVSLALLPLFLLVASLIKLHDRGPVLFWQQRVGRDGRVFAFPKFRSMCCDAEKIRLALLAQNQHGQDGVTFKMKNDPRITPIGRWIRRFSVDELPQLWCVITGDMSLVGPRPALPAEVARYSLHDRARLSVRPGLTCIWQVSGRSDIAFDQQVNMDVSYIQQPSIKNDLYLLVKTVPAVLSGKGAY